MRTLIGITEEVNSRAASPAAAPHAAGKSHLQQPLAVVVQPAGVVPSHQLPVVAAVVRRRRARPADRVQHRTLKRRMMRSNQLILQMSKSILWRPRQLKPNSRGKRSWRLSSISSWKRLERCVPTYWPAASCQKQIRSHGEGRSRPIRTMCCSHAPTPAAMCAHWCSPLRRADRRRRSVARRKWTLMTRRDSVCATLRTMIAMTLSKW